MILCWAPSILLIVDYKRDPTNHWEKQFVELTIYHLMIQCNPRIYMYTHHCLARYKWQEQVQAKLQTWTQIWQKKYETSQNKNKKKKITQGHEKKGKEIKRKK